MLFGHKITHVSPVWFQLKIKNEVPYIDGEHNVDANWIKDLKNAGVRKIVPRIMLEGWNSEDITSLLIETHMPALVGSLMTELATVIFYI